MDDSKAIVIVINNEGIGHTGEKPLADKLTRIFLQLVAEGNRLPRAICLYGLGVRLACIGSPVLDELHGLEAKGVRIILCLNCVDRYALADQVQVGILGGMGDIVDAMWAADSVITL